MQYSDIIKNNNLKVWVDLSTYCNAACPQCHRTNPDGLGKVDWLPLIQWNLKQFKNSFPNLNFIHEFEFCGTWGDPIMNKEILEICEYIIDNSSSDISIKTNGSMREGDFWWNLGVLCGRRLNIEFAVDGTTQEMHSKYRQKTDLFKVLDHLEIVAQTKTSVSVFTVLFKHNENKIYDIAEMVYKLGAERICFVPSNRFYNINIKDFNKFYYTGGTLEKSNLNWKWKSFSLNKENLKKFKNELLR